ncbi:unnamed protein product [Prorocentrum cordatum]|uniref:Nudix hydrolase domain-containing protein n=1 Tax=Prorocentrum cordatum TaxID=2364126 RepID=A0ABN9VWP6_9DINO|nr:unnamed protein product [Polarella glacialis]
MACAAAARPAALARQQLSQIRAGLARASPPRLPGGRRAVVACLLREPRDPAGPRSAGPCSCGRSSAAQCTTERAAPAAPSRERPGRPRRREPAEVCFILRAPAPPGASAAGRRWGGQVALPGGHAEAGESDHEAAARECFEEVGVTLDAPGAYRFLGCVRERRAPPRGGQPAEDTLVVACRVYEQLAEPESSLRLQAAEVAACGWAPLSLMLGDDCVRPLDWSARVGPQGSSWNGYPSVPLGAGLRDLLAAEGFEGAPSAAKCHGRGQICASQTRPATFIETRHVPGRGPGAEALSAIELGTSNRIHNIAMGVAMATNMQMSRTEQTMPRNAEKRAKVM